MLLRLVTALLLGCVMSPLHAETINESYAFAKLGEPKYVVNFTHYDYANPAAPKGGKLTLAVIGTYDNFNRYASRGNPGAATDTLYDGLFTTSDDEPASYYPLIAESARYPSDFHWMEVSINPHAQFQDGTPITAQDVAFTFNKFMTEGVPQFRVAFRGVEVKALNRLTVRINLPKPDKDLALSWLTLPVLPEKFWQNKKFNEPIGYPPLASGPYRVTSYKPGQFIQYSRVKNYWAANLPVNRGRFNFDTIRYDYYLDDNVAFEAFKAGAFDLRIEGSAKKWATQYRGRNFDSHAIVKQVTPNDVSTNTSWLAFNNEKPLFSDIRVRQALSLAFDFEWMNKALFYGAYKRTSSYFQNTAYAAAGYPDAAQLILLAPYKDQLPAEVFNNEYAPPHSDGSGFDRGNLLKAMDLLKEAGWEIKNQQLVNVKTGQPFRFELLLNSGSSNDWTLPFQHSLARLGIQVSLRQVDSSQYLRRLRHGDYDMTPSVYYAMPWPSTDLQTIWQSEYIESTWNTARVKDPIIDHFVQQIVADQGNEKALLPLGQALDRILLWRAYMIPMWFNAEQRLAYWDKFSHPEIKPAFATGLENWWYDVNKAARLPADRR
ncbi:MAG: extracellular solute-binding protein [Pantoea sp.]|uniref:extracellular solute-binding protein n=1 Tax=Pantoea sp. TaxID=69393 RepID=UPI00238D019F|nr:extracellular solute-binding protein [Pantoea sp.]MDE1184959.1 extracellular solute-binding protein [Pantoea sp.]